MTDGFFARAPKARGTENGELHLKKKYLIIQALSNAGLDSEPALW
jgi:hypothetical protein